MQLGHAYSFRIARQWCMYLEVYFALYDPSITKYLRTI